RRLRACVCGEERGFVDRHKMNSSTNVFDVTRDLVIRHHTYLDLIECLVVMNAGIPVTGEATAHDRAEDVDVACERNVGTGRVKGCENVAGRINLNGLRSTSGRGADPKKLHVAYPTRVRSVSQSW